MNVYVRELVSALAQAGVDCTTYTRRWRDGLPDVVQVEPGHRVVHIAAGASDLREGAAAGRRSTSSPMACRRHSRATAPADVVHANYWLAVWPGTASSTSSTCRSSRTFHTLARVKAEGGDPEPARRERAEAEIIGCADAICVSCTEEESQFRRLYGDPPGRIEIVAPGVEHAFFAPGDGRGARQALGLGRRPGACCSSVASSR